MHDSPGHDDYRELFEQAADVIYTTDRSGIVTSINRAGERLLGRSRDEVIGSSIAAFVAPESLGLAMQMSDPEAADRPGTFELEIVTRDERRVSVEVRTRTIHRHGKPAGIHAIARDITWRRRMDEQVRRRAVRLDALNAIIAAADSAPDLPGLLEVAVDRMLDALDLPMGGIWIGGRSVVRGLPVEIGPDVLEAGGGDIARAAIRTVADTRAVAGPMLPADLWARLGIRAFAIAPVVTESHTVGVIVLASVRPRPWPAEDVELISEVAQQVAVTSEGLRLFRETQQRADLMGRLIGLSSTLNRPSSVNDVVARIGSAALALSQADGAAVYAGRADGTVDCPWCHGLSPRYRTEAVRSDPGLPWVHLPVDSVQVHLPGGHRFEAAGPLLVTDLRTLDAGGGLRRIAEPEGHRAIGIWPLVYEGRMIAAISCHYRDPHEWSTAEREVFLTFTWQAAVALENARLYEAQIRRTEELAALHDNLEQSYLQMVLALARAIDARDTYTADHSDRLSRWADAVALELGCGDGERQEIRWAAILHDIGKIGVADGILSKPGPLTREEWSEMQRHPEIGEQILLPVERMRGVSRIVRHHQERWDGSGYPDHLAGDAIPLGARILAVVDSYSAITDPRPYKPPRPHDEAVAELERCAGTKFDPAVVAAFRAVLERPREEAQSRTSA